MLAGAGGGSGAAGPDAASGADDDEVVEAEIVDEGDSEGGAA